ncbi:MULTISPECIES: SPOR domain-containing protein [unclassified Sphingopyxis]|uniref:SPOR domain-containing protein n=1 Tax=unclassified Sphingopyxis TaxID=2614943 RepID=UPI0028604D8C|nr:MULTISPECIES: SPOR domain-containing protein [unclassified Sphingopyxis]MDR6832191.1 cell division septation protein DedD [Sphingopyxis sp. BE122]MDR7227934.1 cell division septation protein DedD [Sphingopyxis sp. BE259]
MRHFRTAVSLALPLIAATMLTAPAHADVKDGVDAWQRGDYQAAVAAWRAEALAGDADAQFNLGQAYKLGRGVPADLVQAESWYRRAAKQGHLQAEDNLGLVLFTANRRDEAMPFITRSAERGEPRAQYVLGTALFNGDLAPQDLPRAYALTKRASDAGLGIASARLAQLDMLIPLDQRQRGIAMLPAIEKNEARARLTAVTAAAPAAAKPAPASPIKTASLPASAPGTSYTPPPVIAAGPPPANLPPTRLPSPAAQAAATAAAEATAAATAATDSGKPGTTYAPPPANDKPSPAPVAAKPKPPFNNDPITIRETPTPARPGGGNSPWRAQLGAFGVEANARNLWASLGKKHPAVAARQPVYVKTGKVTRLQTGGFANKGEANNFCAALSKSGQACLVVDK